MRRYLAGGLVTLVALGTLLTSSPSSAAIVGSLTFSPASGNHATPMSAITSGPCPSGTNIILKFTGNGFPAAGYNATGNTATSAYSTTQSGGYQIPLSDTMQNFAAQQNPPATLSGKYDFTATCRDALSSTSLGDFTGSITFTGTNPPTYTSTSASPSASASASASPTTASPSPSASASASPSASHSPSATPSASATQSASASPSATATQTATAAPTATNTFTSGGTAVSATVGGVPLETNPALHASQVVIVTVTGLDAYESADVVLTSTPQTLGQASADANGTLVYPFMVPAGLEPGTHHLTFDAASASPIFSFRFVVAQAPLPITGDETRSLGALGLLLLGVGLIAVGRSAGPVVRWSRGPIRLGPVGAHQR